MNQDKVRGLFLGTAIGDALGMPVEGAPYEKIKETHGRLENYVSAKGHKWFDGQPLGAWTDDTQLTLSVAEAFVASGTFDMDAIAQAHVNALNTHTSGWGPTTKEAIQRLKDGIHWKEAGNVPVREGKKRPRGLGNGIAMKAGPVGAWLAAKAFDWKVVTNQIADFAAMTHRTSIGVSSGLAHSFAVYRCMVSTPGAFSVEAFVASVVNMTELGKQFYVDTLEDDMSVRMKVLHEIRKNPDEWTTEKIIEAFGGGRCYVYDSLPFTYAFFVRNPMSIESLYDCVSAGGDADSNASMLGGMLGALHGTSIFPKHLIDGLQNKDVIIKLADQFYGKVFNNE